MKIPATLAIITILFNMFFIAFGFSPDNMRQVFLVTSLEIIFGIEILLNFLTSYRDPENFESVTNLKLIAQNYVIHGHFFLHAVTVIPYTIIIGI